MCECTRVLITIFCFDYAIQFHIMYMGVDNFFFQFMNVIVYVNVTQNIFEPVSITHMFIFFFNFWFDHLFIYLKFILFVNRYVFAVYFILFFQVFIQHMNRRCKCGRVFAEYKEEEKNGRKKIHTSKLDWH